MTKGVFGILVVLLCLVAARETPLAGPECGPQSSGLISVDLANAPRERIQPFPETIELLMGLGAKNSNKCVIS
jgi:hypothetical protein